MVEYSMTTLKYILYKYQINWNCSSMLNELIDSLFMGNSFLYLRLNKYKSEQDWGSEDGNERKISDGCESIKMQEICAARYLFGKNFY